MTDIKKILKQAAIQIGSGGSAGFVEVCIMHPLDLVKTRLQIQSKVGFGGGVHYNGVFDCLRKMYQQEGFKSYYKGILPPVLAETPKRAVKFFTFEQYKEIFLFGSKSPTPLTFSLAGFCAGITEGLLVNPFEVVKVTLQSHRGAGKPPSTLTVTRGIIQKDGYGLRGINKGLTATLLRNGVFNMVYFGFYHSVKGYLPEFEDSLWEFLRKVSIGFASGVLGSLANIPFDVAKSRIQAPQPDKVRYKSTLKTMALVVREEGVTALYKGLVPKVMRLGPGGAIMLVVYDYMYHFLVETFPD